MLSKTEIEFLKYPESISADYRRVLRHRLNSKVKVLCEELALLKKHGFSVTENCNGVTKFCNGQKSPKQALFEEKGAWGGAPAGIRTRVHGSRGRYT